MGWKGGILEMVAAGRVYRGEIAFACIDVKFVAVFFGRNVDGVVLAVALEFSRFVGDQIAAADDLLKIGETAVEAVNGAGRESDTAGELG